ncbi:MAG: M28 family peptidase [Armatimonadota bacterium]|nr:MAG: M28 family peptidase [Armatimonadota bacterium]
MANRTPRWSASWLWLIAAALALATNSPGQAKELTSQQKRAYHRLASEVNVDNLRRHVETLASFPSRVTGYRGCKQAEEYVYGYLKSLGVEDLTKEPFVTSAPVNRGSSLELLGESGGQITIYPLWPNSVRTSQLPPEGLTGRLVWGGTGELTELSGQPLEGSIVLFDFRCGNRWLNGPRLGAKAVIFVEPDEPSIRGESESKYLSVPINIPRFWLPRRDALRVLARLESTAEVLGRLKCDMGWLLPTDETEKAGILYRGHNIIGTIAGTDSELKNEVVVINAYYDSMCIVPEIAPGAESSLGIASLLELARIFTEHRPKRTIRLLATAGHFEALTGIREYFGAHLHDLETGEHAQRPAKFLGIIPYTHDYRIKDRIHLFCALDLSSQTSRVGMFYKGYYYNYREDRQRDFSDIARVYRENGELIADELGYVRDEAFADGVNPIAGKPWRTFIPGKIALENEPFSLGGGMGVALVTTDDSRAKVDTPWDLPEYVDFRNLHRQVTFLACSFSEILNDPKMPVDDKPVFSKMTLNGGFAILRGRVVTFNPKKGLIPNQPLPGSLVTVRPGDWYGVAVGRIMKQTFMGVRGDMAQVVDEDGWFTFYGVPTINAYGARRPVYVEAYHTDAGTGDVDYAPDLGVQGHKAFSIQLYMTMGQREATVVTFPCTSIALFDIVDPQSLRTLPDMYVYDARTDAEPRSFGYAISRPEFWVSHVEDVALVFAAQTPQWELEDSVVEAPPTRVKVMMQMGPAARRFVLLNASPENPKGVGILADRSRLLARTPLRVAKDMWQLDESRIAVLRKFRIIDQALEGLHKQTDEYIQRAEEAWTRQDYAAFDGAARAAWGYEASAYPRVQATQHDVVRGVLFYLVLLIPFAFFLERLVLAAPDLRFQITYTVLIFAASFTLFRYIHPAFDILEVTPVVMLLAFIMATLATLVVVLLFGKFEAQLKALQTKIGGVHRADIGRMGVAMAAFTLGMSNMRRRRARTVLTCITLVLLTFTVLSFTSVVTGVRYNDRPSPGTPRYNGLMVRNAVWEPLEESAYRLLNNEFGEQRTVAARAWFATSLRDEQSFMRVTSTTSDKEYNVRAAVGLMPEEAKVTQPQDALVAGRWFKEGQRYEAIVPTAVAEMLNLSPADVGKAKLHFSGLDLDLVGIIGTRKMRNVKDLDNELLTPVDFIQMMKLQRAGQQQGEAGFQEYLHLSPDDVIFIPYSLAINLGAQVQSVAIDFVTPEEVKHVLRDLMPRLGFNLYAGMGDRIRRWSSMGSTAITGLLDLFIPILIAALIVLNTMLGSVYERVREIGIFSSVGLAPSHIATLFLAEAFVYAILGAILGYVIGQGTVKIIIAYNLLPGLYLNYSSLSAVASTAIVIGVVLLSTLYPARKASEVATPAVDRRWHVPEPVGDTWDIDMPFAVTGEQAVALNAFMSEWFAAYEEYSIGDFVTQDVVTEERASEHGTEYVIRLMTWLAPFDLGVSQRAELRTVPTTMEDVFEIKLTLRRESGDVSSWKRVNRRFLNTLRKQFLIWRTLRAEDRERYLTASDAAAASQQA